MEEKTINQSALSSVRKEFILRGYCIDNDFNAKIGGILINSPTHGVSGSITSLDKNNYGYYELQLTAEPGSLINIEAQEYVSGDEISFIYNGEDVVEMDFRLSGARYLYETSFYGTVIKNYTEVPAEIWIEEAPQFRTSYLGGEYNLPFKLPRGLLVNLVAEHNGVKKKEPFSIFYDNNYEIIFNF